MIVRVDHVGIAVKDLEKTLKAYEEFLGLKPESIDEYPDQKVKSAFIPIGESGIEVMESTDPEGPVAKYIEAKGEGIQHISLGVDNIDEMIKTLKERGVKLTSDTPAEAKGARYTFIHPKSLGGLLVELVEKK